MEDTAQRGILRDKYSMRQILVLYLSRDTLSGVFFVHMSLGGALTVS